MIDPFAAAPADEAQAAVEAPGHPVEEPALAPVKAAPKKAAVTVDVKPLIQSAELSSKVTVTFKGGSGYDAPWIVVHANDIQDAHDQVSGENAVTLASLMTQVQKAGGHFASLYPTKAPSNNINVAAAPQRQLQPGQPAGSMEAPSWAPPKPVGCEDFVYVTKIKADTGKPWHAWMPPGKDDTRKAKFFYPPR